MALALFIDSSYSRSGTESATMPAPACTMHHAILDHGGANCYGEFEIAPRAEKSDRPAVGSPAVGLELRDDFHGPYLGRSGQHTGGKG